MIHRYWCSFCGVRLEERDNGVCRLVSCRWLAWQKATGSDRRTKEGLLDLLEKTIAKLEAAGVDATSSRVMFANVKAMPYDQLGADMKLDAPRVGSTARSGDAEDRARARIRAAGGVTYERGCPEEAYMTQRAEELGRAIRCHICLGIHAPVYMSLDRAMAKREEMRRKLADRQLEIMEQKWHEDRTQFETAEQKASEDRTYDTRDVGGGPLTDDELRAMAKGLM